MPRRRGGRPTLRRDRAACWARARTSCGPVARRSRRQNARRSGAAQPVATQSWRPRRKGTRRPEARRCIVGRSTVRPSVVLSWSTVIFPSRGGEFPYLFNAEKRQASRRGHKRQPDTVQTDHVDWGFRSTLIYGIDYRYMTAGGWFSDQLLKHNELYGWDPTEQYFDVYFPGLAQGLIVRTGRWIACPDIETQFAPDNY